MPTLRKRARAHAHTHSPSLHYVYTLHCLFITTPSATHSLQCPESAAHTYSISNMHIVVLPLPLQGHVNPLLTVARLLVAQGFTVTVVLPEHLAPKLQPLPAKEGDTDRSNPPSIQYATVPLEPAPPAPSDSTFDFTSVACMIDGIRPGIVALLRKLVSSAQGVSCIITDSFLTWSNHVASEFNIPSFTYYISNAHAFSSMFHTQILLSHGLVPATDPDRIVDCIPGLPPMQAGDLPLSIRTHPSFGVDLAKNVQKAAGVILNTVFELETEPLEAIKNKLPIYSIGPILMFGGSKKPKGGESVGLWTEERECLKWLDTRAASSVLFIAFGSLANVSGKQMTELAEGLEASGQAFLWVIRSDAVERPLSTLLPEGFTDRTKDRGLIISWAPQLDVLSHSAVGGFFTHCGWNSITENLSLGGVPMICWPRLAEQRLNKKLLVHKWKIGLELQEEDGIVKRGEVEKIVKQLMQGEEGQELRRRVLELKEIISSAVQEGGSSQKHLEALGQDIKNLGLTA